MFNVHNSTKLDVRDHPTGRQLLDLSYTPWCKYAVIMYVPCMLGFSEFIIEEAAVGMQIISA